MEIFSGFGNILSVEMIPCTSSEKSSHSASLQSAYIDYETKSEAAKAVKSMNGGKDIVTLYWRGVYEGSLKCLGGGGCEDVSGC